MVYIPQRKQAAPQARVHKVKSSKFLKYFLYNFINFPLYNYLSPAQWVDGGLPFFYWNLKKFVAGVFFRKPCAAGQASSSLAKLY
jgi:hypothetical protein